MGEQRTGGYDITITDIVKEVDHLLVHVDETGPRRGELVTEAFTQPYHMVKVSKSKKKVRFVHDAEIINGLR